MRIVFNKVINWKSTFCPLMEIQEENGHKVLVFLNITSLFNITVSNIVGNVFISKINDLLTIIQFIEDKSNSNKSTDSCGVFFGTENAVLCNSQPVFYAKGVLDKNPILFGYTSLIIVFDNEKEPPVISDQNQQFIFDKGYWKSLPLNPPESKPKENS